MTTAAQWKLRRLAPRAIRVIERRAGDSEALRSYEQTLIPVARGFIESYDGTKRFKVTWQKELAEGKGAVATLVRVMRGWLPRLVVDIPSFDRSTYADTSVPDDLQEDAQRLLETVEERQDLAELEGSEVSALIYADALMQEVSTALASANKEWREAEAADSDYQQALAKTRALAGDFERELIALRSTLAATVGRSDADYQKLRTARASSPDEDDDPNGPPSSPQ